MSRHQTVDGGRIETRTYTAIHDVAWLQERHDWPGLKGIVMVESKREIGDKIEHETTSRLWCGWPTNWDRPFVPLGD